MALPDEILLDIFHMVVPEPLTHTHEILRSGAGHYLPERPWLNSSHHWYDLDSLVSRRYYAFSRQALLHVYTHELLIEYSKGSTCVRPGVMVLHRRRFDVKHTHDIKRLKLSILAPERADLVLAVEKLQKQLCEFPGLCQANIFVETRALRANVHDVEHTLWDVIGVWREAMEKRPKIRMQIALTLLCRDRSVVWAEMLAIIPSRVAICRVVGDEVWHPASLLAIPTAHDYLRECDGGATCLSLRAWPIPVTHPVAPSWHTVYQLPHAHLSSPSEFTPSVYQSQSHTIYQPFAMSTPASRAGFMDLPEETLMQILDYCIPAETTSSNIQRSSDKNCGETDYPHDPSFRLERLRLVNHRFDRIATDLFFKEYCHRIQVSYEGKRRVHVLPSPPRFAGKIRMVRMTVIAPTLADIKATTRYFRQYVAAFPELATVIVELRVRDVPRWAAIHVRGRLWNAMVAWVTSLTLDKCIGGNFLGGVMLAFNGHDDEDHFDELSHWRWKGDKSCDR
ncbi:hypothetical protein LTR10_011926 [Elasticomyces elasticus]|nr:hypothetical protein LTR10_011926 [Elasticomyces elasticus]KAK4968868.1 hypothetical protein LTR42_009146 [Elasticomyces elasticus]